ncbi:uncharacterized protein plekhg4 isoform X2 [Eucyclogobius newberryi]|uniref:uncharacterized protein plekhg4 isoform X2 n=1 Tax=Eucyclogobius newberryi TaxID=166745 RepID=UPI003B5B2D7D
MDSESLDRCLQTALSALYPPFQATSPTVLCQVLSVVERCYRGDGLRYLLHFLLPAKQFLQGLQQDACLPYCGLLFRHEGWPLCLHEKIVVQLCHLDQRLLRPGDFYLLVSPSSSSASSSRHSSSRSGPPTPRLLLCSVSTTSRHVEEQEILELALSSVFTMAWLDSVNRDREQRGLSKMERLLLSAHGDVFRVPWEDLVYPQFVSRPRTSLKDASVKDATFSSSLEEDSTQEKTLLCTLGQDETALACSVNQSTPSSDDSDSEGDYVELTELQLPRFSPQKGSLTQLISQQHKARTGTQTPDKTTTQNVPTQFQNTPKLSPPASKDSPSSCTSKHNDSKTIEEEGGAVAVNGPVILTPVAQPSTDEKSVSDKSLTEGTNLTRSSQQDEKKVLDPLAVEVDCLVNVAWIEEGKDGAIDSKSVEEEKEVRLIGRNVEDDRAAAVEAVGETQDKYEREEEEIGHLDQSEELNTGEMLCTDLENAGVQEACVEIVPLYLAGTNLENDRESAYLDTGETRQEDNTLNSENVQTLHCRNTGETLGNVELSLDAYIDDRCLKHAKLLQTRILYLEATDSRNFELFDTPDVNEKEDFAELKLQFSETKILPHKLDEGFLEVNPDDQCEMEKQYQLFQDKMQRLNAEFENAQYHLTELPESKSFDDDDPDFELEKETVELSASPHRLSKEEIEEMEEIALDLDRSEEMESQNTLAHIVIKGNHEEDVPDVQEFLCENAGKTSVLYSLEAVHDISTDERKSDFENGNIQLNEQRVTKPHEDLAEKQTCEEGKCPETQMHRLGFETTNEQNLDHLEVQHILSEMVDTVEAKTSLPTMDGLVKTHDSNSTVNLLEQQIDHLETEFNQLLSKMKQINHADSEKHNSVRKMKQTASPGTCREIVEPENVATVLYFEEETLQVENISCEMSAHDEEVDLQDQTESLQGKEEAEFIQESKTQDRNNNESIQSSDEALKMDETLQLSGKIESQEKSETIEDVTVSNQSEAQSSSLHKETEPSSEDTTPCFNNVNEKAKTEHVLTKLDKIAEPSEMQLLSSLELPASVEDSNVPEQTEVENTSSSKEIEPFMETETPGLNSQISNPENQKNGNANTERLLSNLETVQTESCESPKTVEETATPLTFLSENGPENEEMKVDNLETKSTNSEHRNGHVAMPKVHQADLQEPANGPKVKTGQTVEVFESRKGQNVTKVPTEGSNAVHPKAGLSNGSVPKPAERPTCLSVPRQLSKSPQSRFNKILLSSGALCLPGARDRSGRALVTVDTRNSVWLSPDCDSAELLQVLLYYHATLRKEVQALGLSVLMDVRRAPPVAALYTALRSLQDGTPGSVHKVMLLINKDSPLRLDKPPFLEVEMLYSMKSLQKHVDLRQLPVEFGGSSHFSQSSWLCYRGRVETLTNQCNNVIGLLQKTIHILESTSLPPDAQNAKQLLSKYEAVMCSILQDSQLVQLQQEGGASLSRLRRDESCVCDTDDYKAAVESVSSLYDQVDELLHRLVTLSNSRTREVHFISEFSGLESGFSEVRRWLEEEGEVRLKTLDEPEESLEQLLKHQEDFKDFCPTAHGWCERGQSLLKRLEHWDNISSSAALRAYEVRVHAFWAQLQDFSQRVTATGQNIDRAVRLYSFLDEAYGWALAGMRHLAGVSMEDCSLPEKCPVVISCLEEYNRVHPPLPDAHFQEMRALAGELRGERGLRQWNFAWAKCQETKKMFDRKMEAALRTRDSPQRRRSDSEQRKSSSGFSRRSLYGLWTPKDASQTSLNQNDDTSSTCSTPSPPRNPNSTPVTSTPQHTPLLQRLFKSPSEDTKDSIEIPPSPAPSLQRLDSTASFSSSVTSPSLCSSSSSSFSALGRRQLLRKTQSFDCPPTPDTSRYGASPRTLSEPARRGNTGVFIKGLEVSSTEAADRTLCPRTGAQGWAGQTARSPSTQSINSVSSTEQRPRGSKLRHIVEEMVTTEREYVRSLRYIIRHYFPEMERPDMPQDLRGKRSVVFGNLEKLLDFHSQFFLKELEACWKHPLRVPHCFLRHQEQFGLYALYSKNKPKSDALLAHHGNSFFRRKQVELGDKMDLSSYLLKPIQRMSKYALLLSDLIKEVGVSQSQEAELATLHDATNMVKFQLRHGNDLLAMDAIRDCDVNLKEQGQLIRQDEFTVWSGRRKCQRHVFLFEDLVLFSKPKRMEGGLDVFIYKHSFKTADVGLTESTGDDGLRFEIWFRRRTSKNQTFLLQASSSEVKLNWTSDVARLLWNQATRNKEMRLKEMVSMGVGSKPFLDIQPSDAAISDRAVHYIMKSRGARTRASIAVSVFDHSNPFKRSVTSDPSAAAGPSSSGLLGPLNLHMFSQTLPPAGASESSFIHSCIEEDEQEHETSSQPSMTTESSGSSSRCLSGSTGSDSGCVSSHLQEALQEEQNPCHASSSSSSSSSNPPPANKQHLSSPYISANAGPVISPATVV